MSESRKGPVGWRQVAWLALAGLAALVAKPTTFRSDGDLMPAGAGASMQTAEVSAGGDPHSRDRGPGEEHSDDADAASGLRGYSIGLGLAALLTVLSFTLPATGLVWGPAIPVALIVFAIAQMGVHLVFFLHLTTGPDNVNNVMALAFGVLIVLLVIGGSLWIMAHLDHNMIGMDHTMRM